jgi:LPS-assembly protein
MMPIHQQKPLLIPTLAFDGGIYLDKKISINNFKYTQTLEPRVFYSYTPYKDQSMLPMFDTALTDLNQQSIFSENQFVGGDRVMDSHQGYIWCNNKIHRSKWYGKIYGNNCSKILCKR